MLEIIPFEPEHLEQMTPREFEAREMLLVGNPLEIGREYLRRGPAFTGLINGEILGCAGIIKFWQGVGTAWLVTTPLVIHYSLSFHRAISRVLPCLERYLGLWRLQTEIHKEHLVSQKWVIRLGFRPEGGMEKYGPDGADYIRFARVNMGKN